MRSNRLKNLQSHLKIDQAWLLSKETDISYYTGFEFLVPEEKEALLLVTYSQIYLFHATFCPITRPIKEITYLAGCSPTQLESHLRQILAQTKINTIAIDSQHLLLSDYRALTRLPTKLIDFDQQIIEKQKSLKDQAEIKALTRAGQIAAQAFDQLKTQIKTGMSEIEVKKLLEKIMTELNSTQPAFPTIVAFGANSAIPHHQPTNQILAANMPILIDFGATFDHYRSDMTRTFWWGDKPEIQFLTIQKIVHQAYQAGLTALTAQSLTAGELDGIVRQKIIAAQFGHQFIHTSGHGVGLDIHEFPSLHSANSAPLKPQMCLTLEPGIYLPGQFGLRFENTLLLTQHGVTSLTEKILE